MREVAGTLLAKGIPSGIVVSLKDHFSRAAVQEAERISSRSIIGVGRLDLRLADYHDMLDMLELASMRLTETLEPEDWVRLHPQECVFDGIYYESRDNWQWSPAMGWTPWPRT